MALIVGTQHLRYGEQTMNHNDGNPAGIVRLKHVKSPELLVFGWSEHSQEPFYRGIGIR
jgi:hypothetical protein